MKSDFIQFKRYTRHLSSTLILPNHFKCHRLVALMVAESSSQSETDSLSDILTSCFSHELPLIPAWRRASDWWNRKLCSITHWLFHVYARTHTCLHTHKHTHALSLSGWTSTSGHLRRQVCLNNRKRARLGAGCASDTVIALTFRDASFVQLDKV